MRTLFDTIINFDNSDICLMWKSLRSQISTEVINDARWGIDVPMGDANLERVRLTAIGNLLYKIKAKPL